MRNVPVSFDEYAHARAINALGNWDNYSDFYLGSSYSKFPQEHRSSKGKLPFRMIRVEQGSHNFVDPSMNETILALPIAVSNQCIWSWKIGGHTQRQIAEPGRMLVWYLLKWKVPGKSTEIAPFSCLRYRTRQ